MNVSLNAIDIQIIDDRLYAMRDKYYAKYGKMSLSELDKVIKEDSETKGDNSYEYFKQYVLTFRKFHNDVYLEEFPF